MTQDEQTVEEIMEKFQRRFGNSAPRIAMRSPDDCDELAEWLQTTLTKVAEEARREERERMTLIAEDEMRSLVGTLYDEFCETQLATEEQWNEAIAPKLKRLGNVIRGNEPDEATARVYKFPRYLQSDK